MLLKSGNHAPVPFQRITALDQVVVNPCSQARRKGIVTL